MKKFRVLSDLHIDVNRDYPIELNDKNVFTVICGDTSGTPSESIDWIKKNCPNGVGISGNHLPYNFSEKSIQELRNELSKAFPIENSFTYLDGETNVFFKEVDDILFIGTCMYTDMKIIHPIWNPSGNQKINMKCSKLNMNDYNWGIMEIKNGKRMMISPKDYYVWFKNAYDKIEKVLNENEQSEIPKDVVLLTHHPLITDYFDHNSYIMNSNKICFQNEFIWASYASDMKEWIKRHESIKCYCCGHIHAVEEKLRNFNVIRKNGSRILIVNNARGYVSNGHAKNFNQNICINTSSWTIER